MPSIDRNAANSMRLRRNQQRGRAGALTSTIRVSAPLQNTGSQIQLNLDSAGGLESISSLLRVKLIDTSLTRGATGIGVNLRGGSGMLISTGLGILLDGASLSLSASGIKITGYMPYAHWDDHSAHRQLCDSLAATDANWCPAAYAPRHRFYEDHIMADVVLDQEAPAATPGWRNCQYSVSPFIYGAVFGTEQRGFRANPPRTPQLQHCGCCGKRGRYLFDRL
jgi:hypothetical protein